MLDHLEHPGADDSPMTGAQWLVAITCGLIVFIDGFDAQAMGFVAPALSAALHVARPVLGSIVSSGLFGMMIGAFVFGTAADRIGRKPVLIASTLTFAAGALLTATATSVEMLTLYRLLTGLGMGGALPNAIALTAESVAPRRRATAVTAMVCGFSLGAAFGGFVAAALIPRYGWPSVFLAGGSFPIVIAIVAMMWLPSRSAQVVDAADHLSPEAAQFPVTRLFTNGRAVVTLLIWVIYFMNLLDLYFINSWLPTIMNDSGIRVETAIRVTALFQLGGIVGAVLLARTRPSFGLLAGVFAWAAVWIFLTGVAGSAVPLLIAAMLATGIGVVGGQNLSHALASQFYTTGIRATGVGWALGIGRIGSIVGPIIGGYLLARGGGARHVLWAAAIPAVIAALAAAAISATTRQR
jgi:AAHS family 4-hydroxybenzoate transporter-like MFS transporter